MSNSAVSLYFEPTERMGRLHVVIRLALLAALAAVGCSSVYWVAYLALPALAAVLIAQKGADRYLTQDAPSIVRVLRWLASAYAYLWLLSDAPPTSDAGGPVELKVEPGGQPTPGTAISRLLTSLPALIVLAVLSFIAVLLWIVGALSILVLGRLLPAIRDFLAATLRYQFRLVAYHLSLVDRYPSFEDVGGVAHTSDRTT